MVGPFERRFCLEFTAHELIDASFRDGEQQIRHGIRRGALDEVASRTTFTKDLA